ncbi:MAG: hypothetical protein OXJ37_20875 [Bryobacterales bacterium]|nr:hypothetical protein [Bryobacterales bacterium]MDE0264869.1 hypothetical protein [Bryobacterales bacterium]MDE0623446.1 hypothetical protein [Bryobacterales bacterium]
MIGTGDCGGQIWEEAIEQPETDASAPYEVREPHIESALSAPNGPAKAYREFHPLWGTLLRCSRI